MNFTDKEAVAIWFQEFCTGESSTYTVVKLDEPNKDGQDIQIIHEDTGAITEFNAYLMVKAQEANLNDL